MPFYQTFPDQPGDSNSFAKLASFPMPPLIGKSFLDIGCNEGFFCGFAAFEGAKSIIGVDNNEEFVRRARNRFPQCQFIQTDWMNYLKETDKKFDVILCASALHYALDQEALVVAMVDCLAPNGFLILELGIAAENSPEVIKTEKTGWVKCNRDLDKRLFATWQGLEQMLKPYAWKFVGESIIQKGDPVPRYVFHVQRPQPYAILLCGNSASGKTTVARRLLKNLKRVDGDMMWSKAVNMEDIYPRLAALAKTRTNWGMLNKLAERMFSDGSWEEYADFVAAQGAGENFVFDGYLPHEYVGKFMKQLERYGYRVLKMELPNPSLSPAEMLSQTRMETRKYNMFLEAFSRKSCRKTD